MESQQPHFISPEQARGLWIKSLEKTADHRSFFPSGFKKHDLQVGKLLRGAFYLLAARAGIGKTAFLFALAYHQVTAGVKAYFCNMEMSVEQMWSRLACLHDDSLRLRELLEGTAVEQRAPYLVQLSSKLVNFSPFFFEGTDFNDFEKAVIAEIPKGANAVLFVDYIGLFTLRKFDAQEKYWLVSEVAKRLKLLARALDIPVISAVQLNRKVEERKDKTPTLADLRDSGELENHADAVFALTKDGDDVLVVDILKNRNGPTGGTYSLHFDGPRVAVEEFKQP